MLYDAATQSLRSLPIAELQLLRGSSIARNLTKATTAAAVAAAAAAGAWDGTLLPGAEVPLFAATVPGSTSFDLALEIALSSATDTLSLSLSLFGQEGEQCTECPGLASSNADPGACAGGNVVVLDLVIPGTAHFDLPVSIECK